MSHMTAAEMEKKFEGIEKRFSDSKELERIENILMHRLKSEGWVEKMEKMAKNEIKRQGIDNVTEQYLFDKLKLEGRRSVSNTAKTEVYELIKKWIQEDTGVEV